MSIRALLLFAGLLAAAAALAPSASGTARRAGGNVTVTSSSPVNTVHTTSTFGNINAAHRCKRGRKVSLRLFGSNGKPVAKRKVVHTAKNGNFTASIPTPLGNDTYVLRTSVTRATRSAEGLVYSCKALKGVPITVTVVN